METIIQTAERPPISVRPMRNGSWLLTQRGSRLYVSAAELCIRCRIGRNSPAGQERQLSRGHPSEGETGAHRPRLPGPLNPQNFPSASRPYSSCSPMGTKSSPFCFLAGTASGTAWHWQPSNTYSVKRTQMLEDQLARLEKLRNTTATVARASKSAATQTGVRDTMCWRRQPQRRGSHLVIVPASTAWPARQVCAHLV